MESEEGRADQKAPCDGMVPAQMGAEIVSGKYAEHREGDDLLNHFELHGREAAIADAVGWNLKTILKEGNRPTDDDDLPERLAFVLQMTVPCKGHEDV